MGYGYAQLAFNIMRTAGGSYGSWASLKQWRSASSLPQAVPGA